MVAHDQFPIFRLVTLLARQMSSPIAREIKGFAKEHPGFGRQVCGRIAWIYTECELRYKIWSLQVKKTKTSYLHAHLSDQKAINLGADILGEVIIFMLGAAIVIFEVNRQAQKQEGKILDEKSRDLAIMLSLEELKRELVFQQEDINRIINALTEIQKAKEKGTLSQSQNSNDIKANDRKKHNPYRRHRKI